MSFPVETAIKTGTSSDYRDAWAVAFTSRYTAGVWMGNLNGRPMDDITGARGPVLALRSLFAELGREAPTHPLFRSPLLHRQRICVADGRPADDRCASRDELFAPGTGPNEATAAAPLQGPLRLRQPHNGLMLAMDPRIPDSDEAFPFLLNDPPPARNIVWFVDGRQVASGSRNEYLWPLQRGHHTARAELTTPDGVVLSTATVQFQVK